MCEFCQMFSLHILRWSYDLSFILLMWYITVIDLHMLNHPCIPGRNPIWSWYMILSMYCWVQFANILLVNLYVHRGYGPCFAFPVVSLSGFDIRVKLALYNEPGSVPSSPVFFGRAWEGLVLILLWTLGRIHQGSHLVLDFGLSGGFGLLIPCPY